MPLTSITISTFNCRGLGLSSGTPWQKPSFIRQNTKHSTCTLLQETHTTNNSELNFIDPSLIWTTSHLTNRSGGISITSKNIPKIICKKQFFLFLEIEIENKKIAIGNIYFQPGSNHTRIENQFFNKLHLLRQYDTVIIGGDFNTNLQTSKSETLKERFRMHRLLYYDRISQPTRFDPSNRNKPTIIDGFFYQSSTRFTPSHRITRTSLSDHVMIHFSLSFAPPTQMEKQRASFRHIFCTPEFAAFLYRYDIPHWVSDSYDILVYLVKQATTEFKQQNIKKLPPSYTSTIFSLIHAYHTKNIKTWNKIALSSNNKNLTIDNYNQLLSKTHLLEELIQNETNNETTLCKSIKKPWSLNFLRACVPPRTTALLALHPDANSPPITDRREINALLKTTWEPIFRRKPCLTLPTQIINFTRYPKFPTFDMDFSRPDHIDPVTKTTKRQWIEKEIVRHLPDSTSGIDDIPYIIIKDNPHIFIPSVINIINLFSSSPDADFTPELLDTLLIFIPKKGASLTPTDLRPISIPNAILRMACVIVSKLLQGPANTYISEMQKAFINGRLIDGCIQETQNFLQKNQGWLLFIDFQKAYDSVHRIAILDTLRGMRCQSSLFNFISNRLKSYHAHLLGDDDNEFLIQNDSGVPQGDPLSPLIYNLVVDPILKKLIAKYPRLFLNAFADDTVVGHLDDLFLRKLQHDIALLFDVVGLHINQKKSAILLLGPDRPPPPSIWPLCPIVEEYNYLGILTGRKVTTKHYIFYYSVLSKIIKHT